MERIAAVGLWTALTVKALCARFLGVVDMSSELHLLHMAVECSWKEGKVVVLAGSANNSDCSCIVEVEHVYFGEDDRSRDDHRQL